MVFSLISKLVNGVKEGVSASLKGAADVGSDVIGVVRDLTINTLKESKEFVAEGLDIPASIVKGAFEGVAEVGGSAMEAVRGIVSGTVQGFMKSGGDQVKAVRGAVGQ